ncbi:MAG: hemerythrin domain-containing protein [Chitinophagaceae bacterium]
MAKEIQPIKRSKQLAPLSREHHEGLLFVWKIRQGIKYNIVEERISSFCDWFWQHYLQQHFKKEELVLPQVLPASHPLMQQMFKEHKVIKNRLHDVYEDSNYKMLEQLAQSINDHIRFEERQLFNEIEKAATPQQLNELAEQLKDEKKDAVWEDKFWMKR